MPPKAKKADDSETKKTLLTDVRAALRENRPRDAITLLKTISVELDAEIVYLLGSAYRDALHPIRKAPRPEMKAQPGTPESADELQKTLDLETETHAFARQAVMHFEGLQKQRIEEAQKAKRELVDSDETALLLSLEIADFKRYMVEALDNLQIPCDSVKQEISALFDQIQAKADHPNNLYVCFRAAINRKVFENTAQADTYLRAIAAKESSAKSKKLAPTGETIETFAPWPLPVDDIARLRAKLLSLNNYFSCVC
jgi:hypothetical protein